MKKRLFTLCLALTAMCISVMADELYVGGKQVSLSGSGTVTVSGGDIKSGTVTYDRSSKTLTLKNVTITRSGNNNRGIRSSVSGLKVVFSGTNTITTTTAAGLRFEASATITGSGTVTVKSSETALYVYKNTTVTISGQDRNRLTLNLSGQYGIQGETSINGEKVSLQRYVTFTASGTSNTVKNLNDLSVSGDAYVKLTGHDQLDESAPTTVKDLASLTLGEEIAIYVPKNAVFDSSKKTIRLKAATVGYRSDIIIKVAGIPINETLFPDAIFRSYVADKTIDKNSDSYLDYAERQAVTEMDLSNKGISNLKGIELFTALSILNCWGNSLKSLDISKNTALTMLECSHTGLKSLDLSKNTALLGLGCQSNGLESLDVSNNTALERLMCGNNSLGSLDVSKNTALTSLYCNGNGLKSLDVSKNTALTSLYCNGNGLKSLDVSKNTALTRLECYHNQIDVWNMGDLVLSLPHTQGTLVVCRDGDNPDNFITKSQVGVATTKGWKVQKCAKDESGNWVFVDYAGSYKINIDATNFPDDYFRNYLLSQDYGKDGMLTEDEIKGITKLDVNYKHIKNLTGIEYFTALTCLVCYSNSLEFLDVSKNTALTELECHYNSLKSLDVSKNTALTYLVCNCNGLESLDVSKNTALTKLYCGDNSLKSLDVSRNTSLIYLECAGNQIEGSSMDNLVNGLPDTQGTLYVCDDSANPDNVITKVQIKVATDNGWKVQKYTKDESGNWITVDYAGQGDVNGDNNINQADLDLLVKIIMGQQPAYVLATAGDLNQDGKTNAADIVVLVNILNGK